MNKHHPPGNTTPRDGLLQQVTARAVTDPAFRTSLLIDPERAVRAAFGTPLPAGQRIRFVERPHDVDLLIVLPDAQKADDELTDDDLDAAAGGDGECPITGTW